MVESPIVHYSGFAIAVPADLLDAVIKLILVAVGIEQIGMPVRSRHIATRSLNLDVFLLEPFDPFTNLPQTAYLPGDLIDRNSWLFTATERIAHPFGKQDHRMMVSTVAGEVAIGIPQPRDLIGTLGAFRVIHDIRYSKPQPIDVKPNAVVHIRQIKPEVAEATDFEGLVEKNSANVKFIRRIRHDAPPKARNSTLIYNVRALSTTLRQRMMEKWSVGVMVFATLQYSNTPLQSFFSLGPKKVSCLL